jgi:hypothetical protein
VALLESVLSTFHFWPSHFVLMSLQRRKLQNEVRFGDTLDLFPYTADGLREKEQQQQQQQQQQHSTSASGASALNFSMPMDSCTTSSVAIDVPSMTSSANDPSGGGFSGASSTADASPPLLQPTSHPRLRREDCQYELRGVIVHSGTARGGHYMSYVRPRDGAFKTALCTCFKISSAQEFKRS